MSIEDSTVGLKEGERQATSEADEATGEMELKKWEKLTASRLYFVRLPKPAELSTTSEHDREKDAIDERLRKLSDELQPVMTERSSNAGRLAEAREAVRELKAQIEDKELILNPYRQERKAIQQDREAQRRTREEHRQAERKAREEQYRAEQSQKQKIKYEFSNQYGHLGVSNDDEIDEKIRTLEFQQQHESLTIAEEKAVLKKIKQLQESREAVRTYSQWAAVDKAEREAKAEQAKKRKEEKDHKPAQDVVPKNGHEASDRPQDPQKEEMEELKRIVDGLWEDYKMQLEIKKKHQEIENGLKLKIEALFEKRDALRKEREAVWAKIQKHRSSVRAANKPFSDNRSFSASVRELVKRGKAEEARQMCAKQITELMEQYASDDSFRTEYNKLWDAAVAYQRPAPTSSDEYNGVAKLVIANALEAARLSVVNKHNSAKSADSRPAEALKPAKAKIEEVAAPAAPVGTFQASKPSTIPGMEEADKPKPRPKKDKKGSKLPTVEIPKIDDTPFVPPAIISEKESAVPLSAAELKEQERERNRVAAEEAALRKERRRQAQEKKRKQKTQQRAAAELQQPPPPQVNEEVLEEVSAPETPPVEEVGFKPPNAPQGLTAAVSAETSRLRSRSGKPAKERKAPVPKPRPFSRKKTFYGTLKGYSRNLYSAVEEHPLAAGASGLVAAVVLAIVPALYFYN